MYIRKAKSTDAKEIVDVNVKTWLTTYSKIMPQEVLDKKQKAKNEDIKKCAKTVEKDDNVFVAIDKGKIVGIASYGKIRSIDEKDIGELYSIYVLKDYQRRGIGEQLFKKVKQALKEAGYNKMVVTCLKRNPYNKFYIKMGGKIEKMVKSNIFGVEIEENLISF